MIILLTGTPGTGKSTISKLFSKKYNFRRISISAVAIGDVCLGEENGSRIVDINKLSKKIKKMIDGDTIIDGHLSHHLSFGDIVIVLRTRPKILEKRLSKKGFNKKKITENLEAEALDVCLIESLKHYKKVYEIDTSHKKPLEVVNNIRSILDGKVDKFLPGKIDWSDEFFGCES